MTIAFFQPEKIKLIINNIEKIQEKKMKSTLIKISTNNRNAIQINWNFNGLLMPKISRRHVFLCPSNNEKIFNYTLQLLDSCYDFFKNGDLYTMALFNQSTYDWYEKTKIEQVSLSDFQVNRESSYKSDEQGLKSLLKKLTKYKEPTFVVICNDGNMDAQQIQRIISDLRERKDLGCLFMISSHQHKQTSIQFSKGICYVGTQKSQITSLFKYYDEHLACIYAQITLESQSGNIYMNNNNWKSLEFSMLSRKIYYPLAKNLTDLIQTYRLCSEDKTKWNFKIQLKYKLLNGNIYTGKKQIEIPLVMNIEKFVTFNKALEKKNKNYQLCYGIELKECPFTKQYMLDKGV